MYDLKRDWTSAVLDALARGNKPTDADGKTYDYSVLDRNADGKIDCITVIYAPSPVGISAGWGSPLWDYRDYCSMVSLTGSGKTYVSGEYVQLTFSYKSGENVALIKARTDFRSCPWERSTTRRCTCSDLKIYIVPTCRARFILCRLWASRCRPSAVRFGKRARIARLARLFRSRRHAVRGRIYAFRRARNGRGRV